MTTYHAKYPSGTEPVKLTYQQSTDLRLILIKKRGVQREQITLTNDSHTNSVGSGKTTPEPNRLQSAPGIILGISVGVSIHTVGTKIDVVY